MNLTSQTTASGTRQYIYNVQNRLIRVEENGQPIAEYGYDPFGRRLWKDVSGIRTYFLYSDEGLVAEYDGNGVELRSYGYKPDSTWGTDPLWLKENGNYYWYQNDHLGTPQKLVDSSGIVVWSATYSAFGEATISVETVTNHLRFPGQYVDAETGWHYNWHRYYAPGTGRYTKTDPIGFEGGDMNLYNYGFNHPINKTDPFGLNAEFIDYNDSIVILLPIIFNGEGATPEVVEKFEKCIENKWSGVFEDYHVVTAVITGNEDEMSSLFPKPNVINVPPSGTSLDMRRKDGSVTYPTAAFVSPNQREGVWPSHIRCGTAAHEAGHLMGLPDQYTVRGFTCVPNEGYEENIMSCGSNNSERIPFEEDFEIIRKNAKSPYYNSLERMVYRVLQLLGLRDPNGPPL